MFVVVVVRDMLNFCKYIMGYYEVNENKVVIVLRDLNYEVYYYYGVVF